MQATLFDMRGFHTTPEAEEVYGVYPRKIAKPEACKAIIAAIKKHGFDHVLEKTKEFAEKVRSAAKEMQFIPYPATFFNQERYNDDFDAMFPARVVRASPAQRCKAVELLLEENSKAMRKYALPDPACYVNGKENSRYQKDLQDTLSQRTALKEEQIRLRAQLKSILQEIAL